MLKRLLFIFFLSVSSSYANSQSGCTIMGLVEMPTNPLIKENNCSDDLVLKNKDRKTGITETLMSVKVLHENEEVLIQREALDDKFSCPPFCIQPLKIKEVQTLGELEVLAFIDKLKEKKARLLIDVRESVDYEKSTIPGAINIPFSMLRVKSKYQEEILKLLGAKAIKKNSKSTWSFKEVQTLLIFGTSATTNEASSSIKELLRLGYPSSKLFYYRSGITSWKALGLTVH